MIWICIAAWVAAIALVAYAIRRMNLVIQGRGPLLAIVVVYGLLLYVTSIPPRMLFYPAVLFMPAVVFLVAGIVWMRVRKEQRFQQMMNDERLDEAEAFVRKDLARKPNALAYNRLGLVHHAREDWTPAREAFEEALKLSPRLTVLRANLGLAMWKQGDPEGVKVLEQARDELPGLAAVRISLTQAYAEAGRLDEARAEHAKALELTEHQRDDKTIAKSLEKCRLALEKATQDEDVDGADQ